MTNPSPFLAPARPSNSTAVEDSGGSGVRSLTGLVDSAATAIVTLVLRWIDDRDHAEHGRAR